MLSVEAALKMIQESKNVAVVGLSPKTDRPSHEVAHFLQKKGLTIIPINPKSEEILGEKVYKSLMDLEPGSVDWVDFFVNPAKLPEFLEGVLHVKPKMVWCQLSVVNLEFGKALDKAGIPYIMDHCPKIEWK